MWLSKPPCDILTTLIRLKLVSTAGSIGPGENMAKKQQQPRTHHIKTGVKLVQSELPVTKGRPPGLLGLRGEGEAGGGDTQFEIGYHLGSDH